MKPSINGGSWASYDASTMILQNTYERDLSRLLLNRNEFRFRYENSDSSSNNFEYSYPWKILNKLNQFYQNKWQQNYPANNSTIIQNGTGWYAVASSGWTANIANNTWPIDYTLQFSSIYNYSPVEFHKVNIRLVGTKLVLSYEDRSTHDNRFTVNTLIGVRLVQETRASDNAQRLRLDIKYLSGTNTNSFYLTLTNNDTHLSVRAIDLPGSLENTITFISNSDDMSANETLLGSVLTPYRTNMQNNNIIYKNDHIRNDPYIILQNFPQITVDSAKSIYIDFESIPFIAFILSVITGSVGQPVLYYITVNNKNVQKIRIAGWDNYDPITITMDGTIAKFTTSQAGSVFSIIMLGSQATMSLYMNLTYDDN